MMKIEIFQVTSQFVQILGPEGGLQSSASVADAADLSMQTPAPAGTVLADTPPLEVRQESCIYGPGRSAGVGSVAAAMRFVKVALRVRSKCVCSQTWRDAHYCTSS